MDFVRMIREMYEALKEIRSKLTFDAAGDMNVNVAHSDVQVPVDIQSVLVKKAEHYFADEAIPQRVELQIDGYKFVEAYAEATAATTFTIEVSYDGVTWFTIYQSAAPETSVRQTFNTGAVYVRLSSAPAGTAGTDRVTLILAAKP